MRRRPGPVEAAPSIPRRNPQRSRGGRRVRGLLTPPHVSTRFHRLSTAALLALLLPLGARPAPAQPAAGALDEVLTLNRQGLEKYAQLDVDAARQALENALARGQALGAPAALMARTHLNLGVVALGGLGDRGRGLNEFRLALQADPSVQLDPLTSTPEIASVFLLARQSLSAAPPAAVRPAAAPAAPAPAGPQLVRHTPPRQQLSQTPVPIYVEVAPFLRVGSVELYYRGRGMTRFEHVRMRHLGSGWAAYIPCLAVFQPGVDYSILVQDPDGHPVTSVGTPQQPVRVPVVTTRTGPAASLPGLPAPEACVDMDECPPNMEGCHAGPTCGNRRCEGDETSSCEADCFGTRRR